MFIPLHRISKKHILEKFEAFNLPLRGMSGGVHKYEYELGREFFENMESSDIRTGDVKVSLTVRYENDTYYLAFKVAGTIVIPCDRCLDDMEHSLDTEYSVKVKYGQEYSEDNDELIVIPESEANFNVANLIYDTVALTIPLKHVHPAGMCNKEMAAQLKLHSSSLRDEDDEYGYYDEEDEEEETSGSEEENEEKETDPRWAALKNIKLENN